jgi:hypothetical protein
VRALVWLATSSDQWGQLARVAAIGALIIGLLLGGHYTIGEPR